VVVGETPKQEREDSILDFRLGQIDCLVTVLALSVGFDVPDVDCIIWCRPTRSPVLYVQGMGRGTRIADGKTDCLVLDFTDTVERLGPVDTIKGRAKKTSGTQEAPYCICPECGDRNHAAALVCASCGAFIKDPPPPKVEATVSYAQLISSFRIKEEPIVTHDISLITYSVHTKIGKPDSLRVEYYSGLLRVATEWICFNHTGYAQQKARDWWSVRSAVAMLSDTRTIFEWLKTNHILEPARITTKINGKFTEIKTYEFTTTSRNQNSTKEATA
jgi:DNA repair protein RadD